jgi:hypothetical protein
MFNRKIKNLKEIKLLKELEYELVDDTSASREMIEEYKTNLLRYIINIDSQIEHEEKIKPLKVLAYLSFIYLISLFIYAILK